MQAPSTKAHSKRLMPSLGVAPAVPEKTPAVISMPSSPLLLTRIFLSRHRKQPGNRHAADFCLVSAAANDLFGLLLRCGAGAIIDKTTSDVSQLSP